MPVEFAEPLEMLDSTHVRWRGGQWTYFGGCDYLRLSLHPRIRRAIEGGPVNVAASRMTTGNHPVYAEAERSIAEYFRAPTATLCSSGYLAAIAVGQALAGEVDAVLIDEKAHGCLRDAARLAGGRVGRFRHRDAADLGRKAGRGRVLVMTEGVFAADGTIAPIDEYLAVLPKTARLLVDDAHAAGVLGKGGRGTWEHFGVERDRIIQTVTFSKAFGVYGGAVLGDRRLRQGLIRKAGVIIGNTPPPPMLVRGVMAALKLATPARCARLKRNAALLPGAPAFPVFCLAPDKPGKVAAALREAGIHPPFIRYPGGAVDGFFRFAVSSAHTVAQVRDLVAVLREVGQ